MKAFSLDEVGFDPQNYGMQGNALLGIKESGKTYASTLFAERLFEAGIPFTAFDAIGVWKNMRRPGKGRGYPIVVAGGTEGDLPLTPDNVGDIVRAAMQGGISLVIDLYTMSMSKADWRRIMLAALRVMLYENHQYGLRHVFIEEAAEFVPQKPVDGHVYAEVEKLCRMGGNAGLGYTLINQRPQELAKSVLELCENLFLFRQKGHHTITYLRKWMDAADKEQARAVSKSFLDLPSGQCWAWMAGKTSPQLVKVPEKNSLHPDRRMMRGQVAKASKPVDVGGFIASMKRAIEKAEQEKKAAEEQKKHGKPTKIETGSKETVSGARVDAEPARIDRADLIPIAQHRQQLEEEYQRGDREGYRRGQADAFNKVEPITLAANSVRKKYTQISAAMRDLDDEIVNLEKLCQSAGGGNDTQDQPRAARAGIGNEVKRQSAVTQSVHKASIAPSIQTTATGVPGAATKMLAVLDTNPPRSMPWEEIALRGGLQPNGGHYNSGKKYLIDRGLVLMRDNLVQIASVSADSPAPADDYEVLLSTLGGAAAKLLQAFDTNPPQALSWPMAAAIAGIKPSGGHFNSGRKALLDYGLVVLEADGRGVIRTPSPHAGKPIKSKDALIEHWKAILSPPAAKLLGILQDGSRFTKIGLATKANLKPQGGHWNTAVKELKDHKLVYSDGDSYQISERIG